MGGPTVLCPKTHCLAGTKLLERLKPHGAGEAGAHLGYQDEVIQALKGVHMACETGSAVIYDSRIIHCGGANLSGPDGGARRRVLVATFAMPKRCLEVLL